MKLEQQVCSLELAKRLKKLGVKQESLFWWYAGTEPPTLWNEWDLNENFPDPTPQNVYAAFTVAELGSLLPDGTISYFNPYDDWQCKTLRTKKEIKREWSEADARARMLIYLIENKLIEAGA